MPKPFVFAVHNWESASGKHEVTVWKRGKKGRTKQFPRWRDAEGYAFSQAKKLGLRSFTIDHPHAPHTKVTVANYAQRAERKRMKRKVTPTRKRSFVESYILG